MLLHVSKQAAHAYTLTSRIETCFRHGAKKATQKQYMLASKKKLTVAAEDWAVVVCVEVTSRCDAGTVVTNWLAATAVGTSHTVALDSVS